MQNRTIQNSLNVSPKLAKFLGFIALDCIGRIGIDSIKILDFGPGGLRLLFVVAVGGQRGCGWDAPEDFDALRSLICHHYSFRLVARVLLGTVEISFGGCKECVQVGFIGCGDVRSNNSVDPI